MAKSDLPMTSAVRVLLDKKVDFHPHFYTYEEHGGTRVSAIALRVPEHEIVKTLVMETDAKKPLIVLMHGDREVSTRQLARILDVKKVEPCDQASAQRYTGYVFGGTSPLGTRQHLPIFAERSIFSLTRIFINGGKRGFLVELNPTDLKKVEDVTEVEVGISPT